MSLVEMVVERDDEALAHYLLRDESPKPARIVIVDRGLLGDECLFQTLSGSLQCGFVASFSVYFDFRMQLLDVAFRGDHDAGRSL